MPYSSSVFDGHVASVVGLLRPQTVCDIGPGAGKYGRLIRMMAENNQFSTEITAVEIDESYVEQFELKSIYDNVIISDAMDLLKDVRCRYDVVVIGDCIEHLRKSDGIDLLNFLTYRSGYIVVIYPDAYIQDDWEGHMQEAHISVWGPDDFRSWKTLHIYERGMHFFLVKGYQKTIVEIADIKDGTVYFAKTD